MVVCVGCLEAKLSANITKLNQDLNPVATTIGRTSLVGCNLESDNPTDNVSEVTFVPSG
jgi:hypothetical protein